LLHEISNQSIEEASEKCSLVEIPHARGPMEVRQTRTLAADSVLQHSEPLKYLIR
jgi:hypothetical protein